MLLLLRQEEMSQVIPNSTMSLPSTRTCWRMWLRQIFVMLACPPTYRRPTTCIRTRLHRIATPPLIFHTVKATVVHHTHRLLISGEHLTFRPSQHVFRRA